MNGGLAQIENKNLDAVIHIKAISPFESRDQMVTRLTIPIEKKMLLECRWRSKGASQSS